jgi:ppGpp synthetase/RelA/SpoT-type nucleotidyltranferase
MDYVKPKFNGQQINAASKVLLDDVEFDIDKIINAYEVINNWRASHHFPLNSFYITLLNRARKINGNAFGSQRIKRMASILAKLRDKDDMKLSQMQDIGGCRVVMPRIDEVYRLRDIYLNSPLAHTFIGQKDYINDPRDTGYRGIHLKYRYSGKARSTPWNGLKIELQVRTQLQHQWATAVEAAETFTRQALKSNKGSAEWLRFFCLMSSVFADIEGSPHAPDTSESMIHISEEIRELDRQHHIVRTLRHYRTLIIHIEKQKKAKYYLVRLDPTKSEILVSGFRSNQSKEANQAYTLAEKSLPKDTSIRVVLVSVNSIKVLKRAYPNYFLDTEGFVLEVERLLNSL